MEQQHKPSDAEVMFNAGAAIGQLRAVDGVPVTFIPEGFQVVNLEKSLLHPARHRGTAELRDADSFIAYVNMHKGDGSTTDLLYGVTPPRFEAVFNAPRPDQPNWADHRARYECPLSHQWKAWNQANGQKMDQEAFARFIETNLPDIVEPEAASMLEIALTLQAKKKVNFASGLRLSNGSNELTYEEQVEGSAAKGKLQIPEKITLGIPVFENGDSYAVEAHFRYRIGEGGKLVMWYELVRAHLIVEDAVNELHDLIQERVGIAPLNGSL